MYIVSIFMKFFIFQRKMNNMHSVQLVLVDLVESLVFSLPGTLISVSLTVTLLDIDSLLEALLDAELLLKGTSMSL